MIGTPRRTCRGRPIICPGPCNHRRQKCIEKKSTEKPHWHACSWFNVNDGDDDDEKEIDVGKIGLPARVDETATMTANVTLIDVALSQITVSLEKKEEKTCPRPVSNRCKSPVCSQVPQTKAIVLCPEQNSQQNPTSNLSKGNNPTTTTKFNWLKSQKCKNYSAYLLIFCLYALIHGFLAVLATKASLYGAFFSSQVCGIAAYLLWRATGTIPL